jgi:hypothetical protein
MKPLALVLALIFVIIGVLYFTNHMPWPAVDPLHPHNKHGIACIIIALLCLVWYRFQSAETAR